MAMNPDIPVGAPVRTADNQLLGRLAAAIRHVVVVERGWLRPEQFLLRPGDISEVRDGTVYLRSTLVDLETHARVG
jgi:hypothetical protein